ncbi:MAG: DUF5667 domain-containing protein [Patescibacteria group bacterium]
MFAGRKRLKAIRETARMIRPSAAALENGRQRLNAFMAEHPALPRPAESAASRWQLGWAPAYRFAGIFALATALFGGGSVAFAHDSLPGEMLYPVKIAGERLVGAMQISAHAKAVYQAQFATRRLDEAKALVESDSGRDQDAAVALGLYGEAVENIAVDDDAEGSSDRNAETRSMFTAHQSTLTAIGGESSPEVQFHVEASLRKSVSAEERLERADSKEPKRPMVEEKRHIAEQRINDEERQLRAMGERGRVSAQAEAAIGDAAASVVDAEVMLETGELEDSYLKSREALSLSLHVGDADQDDDDSE